LASLVKITAERGGRRRPLYGRLRSDRKRDDRVGCLPRV
jgi:hypothetical protein